MIESRARSLVKGLTWRIIGTIDTILISYFFTGVISHSVKIGFYEVFTKSILFYLHERIWLHLIKERIKEHWVSVTKGITWRIIGSIDTTLLAWLITGDGYTGIKIGSAEVMTKIILFYFHERLWVGVPKGTIRKWFPFFDK